MTNYDSQFDQMMKRERVLLAVVLLFSQFDVNLALKNDSITFQELEKFLTCNINQHVNVLDIDSSRKESKALTVSLWKYLALSAFLTSYNDPRNYSNSK